MYLCRDLTDLTLVRIAEAFGRDHSTVLHAVQRIQARMAEQRRFYDQVADLTARIAGT
jgi:chromosomal replication initiator protein